jgi:hypothetical protein
MVPKMAITIPNAAIKFPLRALAGLPSIFKPRINVVDAMR